MFLGKRFGLLDGCQRSVSVAAKRILAFQSWKLLLLCGCIQTNNIFEREGDKLATERGVLAAKDNVSTETD